MSFNPLMTKLVPDGLKTVCELGNQTFNGGVPGIKTTAEFYKSKGYADYKAIDVNSQHGSMVMDLNTIIAETYGYTEQFDLVTNNGTGEHLFNQVAVFTNMHNLCRYGGYMLHVMPFVNWLNHCFFNFHPVLYMDVAHANQYSLPMFAVGNRHGTLVEIGEKHLAEAKAGRHSAIRDAVQAVQKGGEPNVMIIAMFKKLGDGPFKIPMQGKYARVIEEDEIRRRYA